MSGGKESSMAYATPGQDSQHVFPITLFSFSIAEGVVHRTAIRKCPFNQVVGYIPTQSLISGKHIMSKYVTR